jgi:hypothetical protein|tara:strand:+ start:691 stop:987 length:297 start_codon:yes stop_codon:yes gene_type:complete
MSKYKKLKNNPPAIEVKENAREVIFKTISCMCDNIHYLIFRKNEGGDFKLYGNGHSISNWQMGFEKFELEWSADDRKWSDVVKMINTGTSKVASVISR